MSRTMEPVSPPESPIASSPAGGRKTMPNLHSQQAHIRSTMSAAQHYANSSRDPAYSLSSGTPGPNGPNGPNGLPYRNNLRPDEISPRSSTSSVINDITGAEIEVGVGDDDDDDDGNDADDDIDEESDFDSDSVLNAKWASSIKMKSSINVLRASGPQTEGSVTALQESDDDHATSEEDINQPISEDAPDDEPVPTRAYATKVAATLVIEEITDLDGLSGLVEAILPDDIEEAESEREQPLGPNHNRSGKLNFGKMRRRSSAFDRSVMAGLRGFTFRADSDEEAIEEGSDYDEADHDQFRQMLREEKRHRRLTSGSISKRTITESIGSGSDYEDLGSAVDPSEAGSSARRLRRRLERPSILFTDPPAPRIDELDEPDTSDNEDDVKEYTKEYTRDGESLARELPYYTLEYISMEVDSP